MKKIHITLMTAVIALTACTEELTSPSAQDGRISFAVSMDDGTEDLTLTRALAATDSMEVVPLQSDFDQQLFLHRTVTRFPVTAQEAATRGTMINNVTTGLAALGRFGVSGSHYNPTTQTYNDVHTNFFFNAEAVMKDVEWWQTSKPYYLPAPSEKMAFYAYAPYVSSFGTTEVTGLTGSTASELGPMTISYTVNPNPTEQADLITAYAQGLPFDDGTRVNLNFRHALTAISFQLGTEVAPGWYIKTLTLQNIINHARYKIGTGWLNDNNISRGDFVFDFTSNQKPNGKLLTDEDNTLTTAAQTLLMIPQTFTANNQMLLAELYNPTTNVTRTLTHTLNGETWTAGTVINYTVSTSSINYLTATVNYPEDWGGETFTLKDAYNDGDAVGVYAVDINTKKVVAANVRLVYNKAAGTWNTEGDDVIKYKKSYDYFIYYPYKSSVSGGYSEGDSFNGSDPAAFFSGIISNWTVTNDQSTVNKLVACDLQIGMAVHDADNFTRATINMQHALGLAKITLESTDITPKLYLQPGTTGAGTGNYEFNLSSNIICRASDIGIKETMCPNDDASIYYYIARGTVNKTFMSTSTGIDAWKEALTGTLVNGQCYTATALFKITPTAAEYDGWYFDYTGGVQTFTVPASGQYKIECWGASGGLGWLYNTSSVVADGGSGYWRSYGRGGYTAGTIHLTAEEEIYIYVGKQGANATATKSGTTATSWNGGGSGTTATDVNDGAGAGGGATDIRLTSGNWDDFASLKSRIMVAGGGGGAATCNGTNRTEGLHAGGLAVSGALNPWYANSPWNPVCNQTTGNQFGKGSNGRYGHFGEAGGGGGYYGGLGRTGTSDPNYWGKCSGGSSFISGHQGCNAINDASSTSITNISHSGQSVHYSNRYFTDTKMIDGRGKVWTTTAATTVTGVPNTLSTGNQDTGHTGNGFCRIISLTPRNNN